MSLLPTGYTHLSPNIEGMWYDVDYRLVQRYIDYIHAANRPYAPPTFNSAQCTRLGIFCALYANGQILGVSDSTGMLSSMYSPGQYIVEEGSIFVERMLEASSALSYAHNGTESKRGVDPILEAAGSGRHGFRCEKVGTSNCARFSRVFFFCSF